LFFNPEPIQNQSRTKYDPDTEQLYGLKMKIRSSFTGLDQGPNNHNIEFEYYGKVTLFNSYAVMDVCVRVVPTIRQLADRYAIVKAGLHGSTILIISADKTNEMELKLPKV
jgi:hypothetical protein